MVKIKVKGNEFEAIDIRDSFNRRAMNIKNNIIVSLSRLGLSADDVDIELEPNAIKRVPAHVSFYLDGHHLQYTHNSRPKYVENLYVAFKVIEFEVSALIEEKIHMQEFIFEFSEDKDVTDKRNDARAILGLSETENDIKVIDKAYKDLAKQYHPDTGVGDLEKFKEVNQAHKTLKKELT